MLKILGRASSINVRKVLWTCAELELPFTLEEWGAGSLVIDTPEFRALNPNAMVPVLIDGDFVLWESNSICRYLANIAPAQGLLPASPRARATVEQWMDWQATELNTAWRYPFMSLVRQSTAHQEPQALTAGVASWNRHMALLADQLRRSGRYVTGDAFTLADVVLGLSTHRWFMTPMEKPSLPAVASYYERLSERPGFRVYGRNGIP